MGRYLEIAVLMLTAIVMMSFMLNVTMMNRTVMLMGSNSVPSSSASFVTQPTSKIAVGGPQPTRKIAEGPTESDLRRISDLLELAKAGKYPGTTGTRPRKSGVGVMPVWNQRTAILYFNRRQAGDALMWLTLAMGQFANARTLVSDKKVFLEVWEKVAPVQFADMIRVSGLEEAGQLGTERKWGTQPKLSGLVVP